MNKFLKRNKLVIKKNKILKRILIKKILFKFNLNIKKKIKQIKNLKIINYLINYKKNNKINNYIKNYYILINNNNLKYKLFINKKIYKKKFFINFFKILNPLKYNKKSNIFKTIIKNNYFFNINLKNKKFIFLFRLYKYKYKYIIKKYLSHTIVKYFNRKKFYKNLIKITFNNNFLFILKKNLKKFKKYIKTYKKKLKLKKNNLKIIYKIFKYLKKNNLTKKKRN